MDAISASGKPLRLLVFGYPGEVGGAGTELWHTLRLWRLMGVDVTCVVHSRPAPAWQARVDALGFRTLVMPPGELPPAPELAGQTAIAFCNRRFLELAPRLRQAGCRLLWAGCMNWLFPAELAFYRTHGPMDGYLFQSRYQMQRLLPQLAPWGVRRQDGHLIRGAFFVDEFPFAFRPRQPGEPLVLGRLCRPDPAKWPRTLWTTFSRLQGPIRFRLMGWSPAVARHLGPPPPWAELFPPAAMPAQAFYASIHVLVGWGGSAVENWPRIGLEAMAAGVPVVAPATGGWPEMIDHGRTGLLFTTTDELLEHVDRLRDERLRERLAQAARQVVEGCWGNPARLIPRWRLFLQSVNSRGNRS